MVTAMFVVVFNLLADVLYGVLDPRIRLSWAHGSPRRFRSADRDPWRRCRPHRIRVDVRSGQRGGRRPPVRYPTPPFAVSGSSSGAASSVTSWLSLSLAILVCCSSAPSSPVSSRRTSSNPSLTSETLLGARKGPTMKHWFGTDELGRDQLTRMLYAGRISLHRRSTRRPRLDASSARRSAPSPASSGGWLDTVLMRITDLFLIVPRLRRPDDGPEGTHGKGPPDRRTCVSVRRSLIIGILSFLFWQYDRPRRAGPGAVAQGEGVRRGGAGVRRSQLSDHPPPHPPQHHRPDRRQHHAGRGPGHPHRVDAVVHRLRRPAADGVVGNDARPSPKAAVGTSKAYLIYFPGLAILLTVLAVNFLGDGLRDAFDPQSTTMTGDADPTPSTRDRSSTVVVGSRSRTARCCRCATSRSVHDRRRRASTPSTASPSTCSRTRCSASSASRARARASPRWPSSACCPKRARDHRRGHATGAGPPRPRRASACAISGARRSPWCSRTRWPLSTPSTPSAHQIAEAIKVHHRDLSTRRPSATR